MPICSQRIKNEYVGGLKQSGGICMIGDGVNDVPALKTADVCIAMGAMDSDIAVDATDVALAHDG